MLYFKYLMLFKYPVSLIMTLIRTSKDTYDGEYCQPVQNLI